MTAAMTDREVVCTVDAVSHRYGRRTALRDVSFSLRTGQVVGLVGANGSGKSTLLRILAGAQRPTAGCVHQFGADLRSAEGAGRGVGAAIDAMAMWPRWSVMRNLTYVAALAGVPLTSVTDMLGRVGLTDAERTRLGTLSLGNRQRVILAAAICTGDRIVLLDEPMNGLDPDARERIREVILSCAAQGRTVVLSSHDLRDIQSLCHELLVLKDGSLAYAGPTGEFAATVRMSILTVSDPVRGLAVLLEAGLLARLDATGYPVVHHQDRAVAQRALAGAGLTVTQTTTRVASLEERFHERR